MWGRAGGRYGASAFVLGAVMAALTIAPANAGAAIPSVFDGDVACAVKAGGVRFCGKANPRSTTASFDGTPIDVNAAFPPEPPSGPDGGYPLVMGFEGYTGPKRGLDWMENWTAKGYAALSLTMRGFHQSCGTPAARQAAKGACENGYIRMADTRYEVRDAQYLAGRLVDEGLIGPRELAATGGSYGGGVALALAVLRDRVMLPDGSLVAWRSPNGVPMELAAATPSAPWSDLAALFLPNGSTLDYVANSPYAGRPGVYKAGVLDKLAMVCTRWFCTPEGGDPSADLRAWRDRFRLGDPFDGDPGVRAIIEELTAYHSSYYIDSSRPPAPILISAGFTDDITPVDEATRFYSRMTTIHPSNPISLFLADIGHPRAQNPKAADLLGSLKTEWIDYYVRGDGRAPHLGVTAMTQTCATWASPSTTFTAPSWAAAASGEVRRSFAGAQVVTPKGGKGQITRTLQPAKASACRRVQGADQPGIATYRLPAVAGSGYTLAGAPTVIADIGVSSPSSQLAARLMDVAPNGTANLIARGVWRPAASSTPARQVFQLQANAWHFQPGHVVKLELVPHEAPFWKASTGQGHVTVSNLELRLPVREGSGAGAGAVSAPAPKALPPGYTLARGFEPGIHVSLDGSGSGVVRSSPAGIDCGTACTFSYPPGTKVTLTATPQPGSAFAGWSGGGCSGTGTCVVTAGSTVDVRATFVRTFTLRVTMNGGGTVTSPAFGISCASDCSYAIPQGATVPLRANPAPGWRLAAWAGGGCGGAGACEVPMDQNRSVHATFAN